MKVIFFGIIFKTFNSRQFFSTFQVEASSPTKVVGKRRGRPPKNSPRFIKKSTKTLKVSPKTPPKAQKSLFDEKMADQDSNSNDIFGAQEEKVALEVAKVATLDGRRSIEELRPLFRAWIRFEYMPTL